MSESQVPVIAVWRDGSNPAGNAYLFDLRTGQMINCEFSQSRIWRMMREQNAESQANATGHGMIGPYSAGHEVGGLGVLHVPEAWIQGYGLTEGKEAGIRHMKTFLYKSGVSTKDLSDEQVISLLSGMA